MLARATVIKFTSIGLLFFGVGFLILNYFSFKQHQLNTIPIDTLPISRFIHIPYKNKFRVQLEKKLKSIKANIQRYRISSKDNHLNDVFIRQAGSGKIHILLLPGLKPYSKIWEDIGTLQTLSSWNYRVFAVDIPKNVTVNAEWLQKLIKLLKMENIVIISPTISGPMTLEYMFQLHKKQNLIRGFVFIDPMDTKRYPLKNFQQLNIPTLIVHGEKDVKYKLILKKLREIPQCELLIIKNASYQSLTKKPMEFHQRLQRFLSSINKLIDL